MTTANGKAITSVALYARVSTGKKKDGDDDTEAKKQDPEMQLRELRDHCQRQGWTIYAEYVDKGISGSKDSRPQLDRMMQDAQARKFEAVLVWKMDRFSRSLRHLILSLEALAASHVAFVSLRDNLDLTTASGQLMFHVIGAFAQFERAIIRERVQAGLNRRKSQLEDKGFFISKQGNRCERLGRKERTDIDVPALLALRSAGMSWRKIAAQTGIPAMTIKDRCTVNPKKMAVYA